MWHQQQVLQADVAMRDPVLLQVLQAVAELQEEEAHTALIDFWLSFMERRPLPDKVSCRLSRDLRGDDHHSLSLYLLARRRGLRQRGGRWAGQRDFVRGQHALGDTGQEVATVLLQVEVGGHTLLH